MGKWRTESKTIELRFVLLLLLRNELSHSDQDQTRSGLDRILSRIPPSASHFPSRIWETLIVSDPVQHWSRLILIRVRQFVTKEKEKNKTYFYGFRCFSRDLKLTPAEHAIKLWCQCCSDAVRETNKDKYFWRRANVVESGAPVGQNKHDCNS